MKSLVSFPVKNKPLTGTVVVPGDKSISHRSLMFAAIAEGQSRISGLLEGEDVLATAGALAAMGVTIERPPAPGGDWIVTGVSSLKTPAAAVDLGNSGTSTRLLMGLCAGYPLSITFTGDASLSRRPMARVITPLSTMGAVIAATDGGKLPLTVTGSTALKAITYTLPVASAQVKSAILLAGLHASGETVVIEPVPTRDHSERMLRHFGVNIVSESMEGGAMRHRLTGGAVLTASDMIVPSDPSSAAFMTVAALITPGSDIVIPRVSINPLRAGIYTTLIEMGAAISFENESLLCGEPVADIHVKASRLYGVHVPPERASSMIDEFPILSIAASFAEGRSHLTNLAELRVKESDRLSAITAGLKAAGVDCEMGEDWLIINGRETVAGGCMVATHLDHRIAMSFLVMGLAAQFPVSIDDQSPIATSFPDFIALLNGLGATIA